MLSYQRSPWISYVAHHMVPNVPTTQERRGQMGSESQYIPEVIVGHI